MLSTSLIKIYLKIACKDLQAHDPVMKELNMQ